MNARVISLGNNYDPFLSESVGNQMRKHFQKRNEQRAPLPIFILTVSYEL